MYTDELIEQLITCAKVITESPREGKEARAGYNKQTFALVSVDGAHTFSGFINQNETFPEHFSIGLVHHSGTEFGKVVLLRCNGPHGDHVDGPPHHLGCHIHKASADLINEGIRGERNIEMTAEYVTIEEAIQYYIRKIGIEAKDRKKHFPPPNAQLDLFGAQN